jgi:hypothetical protein
MDGSLPKYTAGSAGPAEANKILLDSAEWRPL